MDFLTTVAGFLAILTIIVFIHEMGHFLVARWCGVHVHTFSIGFGKELWHRFDRHGTRWRIAAVPLGGYVKFIDDANAASAGTESEEALAKMTPEERAGAFRLKPLWQRAAVVAAGPMANFILAIFVYAVVFGVYGVRMPEPVIDGIRDGGPAARAGLKAGDRVLSIGGTDVKTFDDIDSIVTTNGGRELDFIIDRGGGKLLIPVKLDNLKMKNFLDIEMDVGDIGANRLQDARIGLVSDNSPAQSAGLKPGDQIIAIDGRDIISFDSLAAIISPSAGKQLTFKVARGDERFEVPITPAAKQATLPDGKVIEVGRVGIAPELPAPVAVGPVQALYLGSVETWSILGKTLAGVRDIFVGRQSTDQIGGLTMMGEVTGKAMEAGFDSTLRLLAYFSVSIGLLNLFPIPVLDGGHLMFYAFEAVFRKPLPPKVQEIAFRIGFAVLLMLMVFANGNDIIRKAKTLFGSMG